MQPDQRLIPRKVLRTHGTLTLESMPSLLVHTIDISPGGMSVETDRQLPAGQRCRVSFDIFLNGKKNKAAAAAKTIYSIYGSGSFKIGLQFIDIDEQSASVIEKFMK